MSRRKQLAVLVVVLLISLIGSWTGWLPLDKAARASIRPFSSWLSAVGRRLGSSLDEIGNLGSLTKQRDELAAQNASLREQNISLNALEQENQQLRTQLGFASRAGHQTLGADVIAFAPDEIRQFIRINKGSHQGLRSGMVVVSGNQLVGVVMDVSHTTATVMLVSDPDFRVLAATSNGQATGIVKGQAGGSLTLERVPRDESLHTGDIIVTNGRDGSYPAGLEIGTVDSVAISAEGIFQSGQLRPSAPLKRLLSVLVITSYE